VRADGPAAVAARGLDKMMGFLENSDGDLQKLGAFLNREIVPYFDFDYMAKSAAGPLWKEMDAQQRKRLAARIKRQFLATLVERLGDYDRQQIRVVSERVSPNGRIGTVTTVIRGPRGYPARMDFRFYKSRRGWKVYDVMANGQSAVVHYRRQFRQAFYQQRRPARGPVAPRGGYRYPPVY
jgi:phospholipid transport system substrate-binding protein